MLHTATFFSCFLDFGSQDDLQYFRNDLFILNNACKHPVICFPLSKLYLRILSSIPVYEKKIFYKINEQRYIRDRARYTLIYVFDPFRKVGTIIVQKRLFNALLKNYFLFFSTCNYFCCCCGCKIVYLYSFHQL